MQIFIDSANLQDIEEALKRGFASGITTNPSLLAKEPQIAFEKHIGKIIKLIKKYKVNIPLSIEVFSTDTDEMIKQAKKFVKQFDYKNINIKVQIGWDELEVIRSLSKSGVSVNCTACMTVTQGMMAAHAGADYISFFWGRIKDGGVDKKFTKERNQLLKDKDLEKDDFDSSYVVGETRRLLELNNMKTKIIAGSMRSVSDIKNSGRAGAHIVTVPPKFFKKMASHYKTEEVITQFLRDFDKWLS